MLWIAKNVEPEITLPGNGLSDLLVRLVNQVANESSGGEKLTLSVKHLPIVVNSTLQFTLLDEAPPISTGSESWVALGETAAQHGCTLSVLGGESTSYVVSLTVSDELPESTTNDNQNASAVPADLEGKRVLLAEDSPELQRMTTGILSSSGAEVTTVENGVIAMARFMQAREEEQEFDLALLDLQMPMMDGCTVARRMHTIGTNTPTFVLVNNPSSDLRQRCQQAGCTDVISKPLNRESLLQTLRRHCV